MAAEHGCGCSWARIPERIDEQVVDIFLKTEMSLEAVLASAATNKNRVALLSFD